MTEYNPRSDIDSLFLANGETQRRLHSLEAAFGSLYEAILEIAKATNTLDGVVQTKLENSQRLIHGGASFRSCGTMHFPPTYKEDKKEDLPTP
jgi:hypothetical protein